MGRARNWTAEENEYLQENWGCTSVPTFCERLNRSEDAIMCRVYRLGLGPFLEAGDYISFNQLLIAVTGTNSGGGYKLRSWIENRGLPIHKKKTNKCSFRVVYLHEFWKWAEENRSFIDFSKMTPLALGEEPAWMEEQRRCDYCKSSMQKTTPWTSLDDQRLVNLLRQHIYGYAEISKELQRSAGAIQRRCIDLGLRERPVKADNQTTWSENDYKALADGIKSGSGYSEIGLLVGRSEKAVRGRVYETYRTEVADKVRTLMGGGCWGDGAPELTIWEARRKPQVKQDIAQLIALLKTHRNALGFDEFWQKDMCLNWDALEGCTANCSNCDECTEFRRIPPQYCVRCGETFFERRKELRCPRCREQRRKQAARKYYRLSK